ncbi:MAG: rhomboid family intramembrane serine protease [Bdellovibrionia bacterium]
MPIRLTPAVKWTAVLCFVTFLIQQTGDQFFGTHLLEVLGLTFSGVMHRLQVWQILTYSLVHLDVMHLFFNLLMLAFVGSELEQTWGTPRFIRYSLFCVLGSALLYLLIQSVFGHHWAPLVGVSGGIYGLLMAYGLLFGDRVLLFMMLFPMKAKHMIWILACIELMNSVFSSGSAVAGLAHLGGMAAGLAYFWGQRGWRSMSWAKTWSGASQKRSSKFHSRSGQKKRRQAQHLKLVPPAQTDFDGSDDSDSGNHPRTWH